MQRTIIVREVLFDLQPYNQLHVPQPSTGLIPTNSVLVVSWRSTIRTHSYLSLLVRGCVLVGGKSSTDQGTALTKFSVLRFSELEQIAVLSTIVLHYRITVLEEPQYAHETVEERKLRVLAAHSPFVLKPVRTPVVFTPRERANILAY
jgi:hypothetical protein